MFAAYTGNSAYCFTHSLHMCLKQAGMRDVPAVGLIECLTGMPFGATFIRSASPLYLPSPAGTDPEQGLARAIESIGWQCAVSGFSEAAEATTALSAALQRGPALLGPLDMGFLTYDPIHQHRRGGDHYVVVLGIEGDLVRLHDPQFFPFAVLPATDLVRAWSASHIPYAPAPYTLRCDFRQCRFVALDAMLERIETTAREMLRDPPNGPVKYGGASAHALAAEVLGDHPSAEFTGLLSHFSLPLGSRRCADAADFYQNVGNAEVASLWMEMAQAYGQAQYSVVRNDMPKAVACFQRLASLEADIERHV